MEIVTIEKRKLDYILKYADEGLEDANYYFEQVDNKMSKVNIGDKLYKFGSWDDYFELTVVDIIDKENGIVAIKELGYTGHENEVRNEDIFYLKFKEDL